MTRSKITVPAVPAGTRLQLAADDWTFGRGQHPGQPFTIVVARLRTELAHHYDNEFVWVTGHGPDCVGGHAACREALVRTAALRQREESDLADRFYLAAHHGVTGKPRSMTRSGSARPATSSPSPYPPRLSPQATPAPDKEPTPAMTQTQPAVAIREATVDDLTAITALLAEAFLTGPVSGSLIPQPGDRREIYLAFFRVEVERALEAGYVHVTSDLTASALWYPRVIRLPASADHQRRRMAAYGPYAERFAAMATVFDAHHPVEPHHHLAYLAVTPPCQNAGLGGALLDHHHATLDRAVMPAYLEATTLSSRRLYLRHGYRSADPFTLPHGGPPIWPMWRDPNHLDPGSCSPGTNGTTR